MTNDAPERIWAVYGWSEVLSFNVYYNGGTEYIRADHAQAEKEAAVKAAVAVEREACAENVWNECYPSTNQGHLSERQLAEADATEDAIKAIRAGADTDALEAAKAEARAEALRELLQVNKVHRDKNWYPSLEQSILALIPTDQEGRE